MMLVMRVIGMMMMMVIMRMEGCDGLIGAES